MFYGIEVKSSQSKPIVLETTVKLTQAVLEPGKNGKKEPVSLIVETDEKKRFILCVLDPSLSWQCPLDLVFSAGSTLKFVINGTGTVHLTGYETIDDMDELEMSISSDEDEEQDDEQLAINGADDDDDQEEYGSDSEVEQEKPVKAASKKALAAASKPKANGRVPVKRNVPQPEINGGADKDDDEDESDDSDFNASDLESDEDDFDDEEVDIDESLDDEDGDEDEDMDDDEEDDD